MGGGGGTGRGDWNRVVDEIRSRQQLELSSYYYYISCFPPSLPEHKSSKADLRDVVVALSLFG